MQTLLRKAVHEDAEQIIRSHIRSIREVCSMDYTSEQIEAWAGRDFCPEKWRISMDNEVVWVIEHGNQIEGFGHWTMKKDDFVKLRGLYLTPTVLRMGFGKKLMELLEKYARESGAEKITLHATLTALDFYKSHGFKLSECSPQNIQMQGVDIPCLSMEKFF